MAERPRQRLRAHQKEFLCPETARDPSEALLLALAMQEARRSTDLMRFVLIHVIVYKNNTTLSLLSHSGWPGLSAHTGHCSAVHPPKPEV